MSEQSKEPVVDLANLNPKQDPVGALKACIDAWDQLEQQTKLSRAELLNTVPIMGQSSKLFSKPDVRVVELSGREFGDDLSPVGLARAADALLRNLQKLPIGAIHNLDTGWDLQVNKKGRAKMGDNGDLTAADSKAVAGLLELVNQAVLAETHSDDEHKNAHVKAIHRLYAPVLIDAVLYRVKLTVKDYVLNDGGKRKNLHAIETVEIENALLGTVPSDEKQGRAQPTTGRSISIASLMQGATLQDGSSFVDEQSSVITPTGRTNPVKTAKGTKLSTQFAVVEASRLIVSHDASGKPNPRFPQELQPRDRERETSQAWVQKIAANLDTDSLGRTSRADSGAPIVGPDAVVESGNGRTMAIKLAYERGTAEEYRQWLTDDADYFGLDPEKIKGMQSPVLVRVRTSEIDRMREAGMITGDETEVEVPMLWEVSQFKQKALLLDDGKAGKYWSQPLEMAARAYSAYLQDRLAEQGRVNDYLAYSTQGGNSRVGEVAYPQGEERKAINAAFDRVFQAIKVEQVFEKAVQNESLMDDLFGVGQSAEWWIDEEEGCYACL